METKKKKLIPILEEPDNETMLTNEGVWHKEEYIVDMVQNLMIQRWLWESYQCAAGRRDGGGHLYIFPGEDNTC